LSPVGIVSALAAEARHLCPQGLRPEAIMRLGDGALLMVSGMGVWAAAAAARALIEAGAGALLSFGMAGGLDPALAAGTVCLPSEVVSRGGENLPTARPWRDALCKTLSASCFVTGGRLLTSAVAIDSIQEKAQLFRDTGAATVDMESFPIAQEAAQHGLPFMAVRVIVDTARDALPPVVARVSSGGGQVPIGRLLGALAGHPRELPAVIRLGGRYRAASRSLEAVARCGSLAPPPAPAGA
jgi:hopanoid-associated phosphorylase